MRKIIPGILFVLIGFIQLSGQTALYCEDCLLTMREGMQLYVEGDFVQNSSIESLLPGSLEDSELLITGNVLLNGTENLFTTGDRTIVNFIGSSPQAISGSAIVGRKLYSLRIDNGQTNALTHSIAINNELNFQSGSIDLNGHTIFMEVDPSHTSNLLGINDQHDPAIINETDDNRIFGPTGQIRLTEMMNSSYLNTPQNVGGIGAEISQPGMTQIDLERKHEIQSVNSTNGIQRYYDIYSSDAPSNGGSLRFHYLEGPQSDLPPGTIENDLVFFKRNITSLGTLEGGSVWINDSLTAISTVNNWAFRDDLENLNNERFTLVECQSPAVSVSSSADSVCINTTVTLDAGTGAGWSYLWSNGETTQTIDVSKNFTVTEKYYVVVSDSRGCFTRDSLEVSWLDYPTVSFPNATENVCEGDNIDLNPTIEGESLTYEWSTGATTPTINHVSDGTQSVTYSVTVTAYGRCETIESVQVDDVANPVVDLGENIVECDGQPKTLNAGPPTTGSGPFYSWLQDGMPLPSTQNELSVSESGIYGVEVTNLAGCFSADEIEVQISDINISIAEQNDPTCNGSLGNISVNVNGTEGDYMALWSNGDETVDLLNAPAGTYSLTITDQGGCTAILSNVTLEEPDAIEVAPEVTHDYCAEGIGRIISNPQGGTPPYNFQWFDEFDQQQMPFATTQDVSGLNFGSYRLLIFDAVGCYFETLVLVDGGPINADYSTEVVPVSCPGEANGSVSINGLTGGNAPYSYLWSNGANTASLANLNPGTYSVTATDVNGCFMLSESFMLSDPPDASIELDELSNISCFGGADGSLNISVESEEQYSILWSTGATSPSIGGLTAGSYLVTVTYGNDCITTEAFELSEPQQIEDNSVIQDDYCQDDGGSISTGITGGTGNYVYQWSNGASSPDITGLNEGQYTVTVTDENGCKFIESYIVEDVQEFLLNENHEDLACADDNSGSIDIFHTGGTFPITYSWASGQTTSSLSNLGPGIYSVVATDDNGCTDQIQVTIENPEAITITGEVTDATTSNTSDGSIDVTVDGGTGNYSYAWSNGANSEDIIDLLPGIYDVSVVDANNCLNTASFAVSGPTVITSDETLTNPTCNDTNDGSILLVIDGGNEPYSFEWSNGSNAQNQENLGEGTYNVTITDADQIEVFKSYELVAPEPINILLSKSDITCFGDQNGAISTQVTGGTGSYQYAWSHGSDLPGVEDLMAGDYTLTVTDENGCSKVESIEIVEPVQLGVEILATHVSADGEMDGSAMTTVQGGTSPYTYSWSNGSVNSNLTNLEGGIFSLTVTDNNGCTVEGSVTILDPSSISVNGILQNPTCFGGSDGSIDLEIEGGSEPYEYLWSNGATTEDLNGISAGSYNVTVTDQDGLNIFRTFELSQPPAIVIDDINITNVSCGDESGRIEVIVSGGTGDFTFLWSSGETDAIIDMKAAGSYELTITDESGCTLAQSFDINANTDLELTLSAEDASCGENFDGSIDLEIEGGEPPYTIMWSNGQISEDPTGLGPGIYTVTVTDAVGCMKEASAEVGGGMGFSIQGTVTDISCFNAADGSIEVQVEGNLEDYTFLWSNGQTTAQIGNLEKGAYDLTVTNQDGCSAESSFVVVEPDAMVVNLASSLAGCTSEADGSISVAVSGGEGPFSFDWSNGGSEQTISGLAPGNYEVEVTDINGCSIVASTTIQETDQMLEAKFLVASPVRETEVLQFLDLSFPKPTNWLWKFGDPKNQTSMDEDPLFQYPNNPAEDLSNYEATLIVSSVACIDSTSKVVRIINTRSPGNRPIAVEEPFYTEINEVKVYPNPVADFLNTEVTLNQADRVDIRLVNMSGQVLRHFIMSDSQVYYEQINVRGLVPGYYLVHVTSGGDTDIQKVVVVR